MTESEYVLTYLNAKCKGQGEEIRLLFVLAGQKYEDKCIEKSDWPEIKTKTPFGQLPTLTVDGVTITKSSAIARFIANRFGLAGKTDMDSAVIDSYVAQMDDVIVQVGKLYHANDDAAKEEAKEGVTKEFKRVLGKFNECLASSEYLVGGELSWADINLMNWIDLIHTFVPGLIDDDEYAHITTHSERVQAIPSIKQWIDIRPVTEF